MPIYEYQCDECEYFFEELLSMSDREKPINNPCPKCSKNAVKNCFSKPIMGVDKNIKVPNWFQDKITSMKEYTPKRFHHNLDKAADRSGGKLGPQ